MKVFVFSYRDFDEAEYFTKCSQELGIELGICREAPSLENLNLAEGYEYISILTSKIDSPLLEKMKELGIRMISTRTIGYDHIDCAKARELGIQISNAPYSPNGVADYAIMLMLMASRKMKHIMERSDIQDFSLKGIQGREFASFTVGIVGTGRIGKTVLKHLSGFGCKLLAYDLYPSQEAEQYATYVSLEELFAQCDLISLHTPLTEDNYHMINAESISRMKDRVILVNTARGGLIDSEALIEGLEKGKIGAAALDVVEKEFGLYYFDLKSEVLDNRELAILKSFPNVIVTPHMAFYTDQDVHDMVYASLKSCLLESRGEENPWRVQ